MLLSKSCEYGLRAVLYLVTLKSEGFVSIKQISEQLDISFHFLTKILQKLTQEGILHSFRGPNGGVALALPAASVTLLDIVLAIDGPELFTDCVLGLPECGNSTPCPLHEAWTEQRDRLKNLFGAATLAYTAGQIESRGLRLQVTPDAFRP